MKKIIVFIMAAVLLLCMVSCGEADETPTDTTPDTTTENPVETKPWTSNNGENPNDLEIDFKY